MKEEARVGEKGEGGGWEAGDAAGAGTEAAVTEAGLMAAGGAAPEAVEVVAEGQGVVVA
jgi:hypothetical protein